MTNAFTAKRPAVFLDRPCTNCGKSERVPGLSWCAGCKRKLPTSTQRALIREGVRPGIFTMGSGGGRIIADPRTIRSLVAKGLAFKPEKWPEDWRTKAFLTRAAFEFVGAEPPKRHPFDNDKEWP